MSRDVPMTPAAPARPRPQWILALLALLLGTLSARGADRDAMTVKVLGGLAGVSQYVSFEAPFWTRRVPELTGGRIRGEISPFDRSGVRGQETLQLLRLGVVPFATALLGLSAADEPELNAIDLPVMSPDQATLRETVALYRPRIEALLRTRYNVELLAIYTYPAQVMFCQRPFTGLGDLSGRRIRVSSVAQAELVTGLGAIPILVPFAEVIGALRAGIVECAITGTLSGNTIGLHEVTTHVSPVAITWGISLFATNQAAWARIPPELQAKLRAGLAELQEQIWQAAARETEDGLICNAGGEACRGGRRGRMVVVEDSPADRALRAQLLRDTVLPSWIQRCGPDCAEAWNRYIAPVRGLRATAH
ncbi:TRAP transporter substrate-binding protein [Siccirubricoccus sp. KC 17139]|uniref:TRAP transporter substrate-binding protein n=1 Tax=Siccirubricoccus soli TaxID=2899147 RepID=A0ABT1D6N9_9PROT|nr:TRAP transporter substrate-binding protein [Siccirubricoccus soli]MCO6416864.1 TRAP transporter substrate-binding protein [Siccirubricoccus soli]MCP2682999.1 TRAP transporter substrate-binding protein [Siccirubricoccus soli]